MRSRAFQSHLQTAFVGLLATLAAVWIYRLGWLDRLELMTLDLRFAYCNPIEAGDDLLLVGIDDTALERVERWPWIRTKQAAIIGLLDELGATAQVVDLTWIESEPLAADVPADAEFRERAALVEAARLVYPDPELERTLAKAGNCYLAFHYVDFDLEHSAAFEAAVRDLLAGDQAAAREQIADLSAHIAELDLARVRREILRPADRAALAAALVEEPTKGEAELLAMPAFAAQADFIDIAIEPCRAFALRYRIRQALASDATLRALEPFELATQMYLRITGRDVSEDTPLKRAFISALREVLGYEATVETRPLNDAVLLPAAPSVDQIAPVYFKHAESARRCGFVAFDPDVDAVTRRMRLLVEHKGHVLPQLAFALVLDALGIESSEHIRVTDRLIELRPPGTEQSLRIPLDAEQRLVVPWAAGDNWQEQYNILPADSLWALIKTREDIRSNRQIAQDIRESIATAPHFPDSEEIRDTLAAIDQQRARAAANPDPELSAEQRAYAEQYYAELEPTIARRVAEARALVAGGATTQPSIKPSAEALASMARQLRELDRIGAINERLARFARDLTDQLRKRIEGRICLLGYTAVSLADMTPIPNQSRVPGVIAHMNLLNALLSGATISQAPRSLNIIVAIVMGVFTTFVSVNRKPRDAVVYVLFLLLIFLTLAGWAAFYTRLYWMALTPAVAALLLSYVSIAVYRYIFVDRERRMLTEALGQYTSKHIAQQMAENPELVQRAEMREVTTVFTDLRGFTTTAERLGAERTQHVLNVSLGRFTDVMLQHEALVNKFIGDGIFAFWNPVIYPQEDHALRGCETAVDLQKALVALKSERSAAGDPDFEDLMLRVGIATGRAIVGPCGSEQKFDYTCIGDTVNVASRLESANKFFGTSTLVSEATASAVGGRFVFRPLGAVRVKGKLQAVQVFEMLGRSGEVQEADMRYATAFGAAVQLFQGREWQTAKRGFERCLAQRDDPAARNYVEACVVYLERPPGPDWMGAIELTEK